MTRKPSCLISCSHRPPEGSLSVLVGRHGAMNPAGRVRCNMRKQIELGRDDCNFTIKSPHFFAEGRLGHGAERGMCCDKSRPVAPWRAGALTRSAPCLICALG